MLNLTILFRKRVFIASVGILLFIMAPLTSCANNSENPPNQTLTIFAASSLTDAFDAVVGAFEAETQISVTLSFAGSSTLTTQIIEGAPVDLFASANMLQITRLQQQNQINGEPVIFASNRMVMVTTNQTGIRTIEDLGIPGVKLVLAAPGVPIREYTDLVISALATENYFGSEFADRLYSNVVSEEANVRQALAKVNLGEADAAFVYITDVTPAIQRQLLTLEIPEAIQPKIEYPIVTLKEANNPQNAEQFIAFLTSATGQCILAQYQFMTNQANC